MNKNELSKKAGAVFLGRPAPAAPLAHNTHGNRQPKETPLTAVIGFIVYRTPFRDNCENLLSGNDTRRVAVSAITPLHPRRFGVFAAFAGLMQNTIRAIGHERLAQGTQIKA
jgi:hypothetical protein